MPGLTAAEIVLLVLLGGVFSAAAVLSVLRFGAGGEKYRAYLPVCVSAGIVIEVVILAVRAVIIKGFPLTSLFESMLFLTIIFSFAYLFLNRIFPQVWFDSMMVWMIILLAAATVFAVQPAGRVHKAAATLPAILHGAAMLLGGACVMFSTAAAIVYLVGSSKLKHKQIVQVIGRVPNFQRLERMMLAGMKVGFLFITVGLVGGILVAAAKSDSLGMGISDWLKDAKILAIAAAWLLLGVMLALEYAASLNSNMVAYAAIAVFVLVLFAIAGTKAVTKHSFYRSEAVEVRDSR
jgi:ABC-type uncharacterized transport system permease subunit